MINANVYERVSTSAGLFDATHSFGRLYARGKDALDLLHRMSTNDIQPIGTSKGQAVLTALLNEKGRFIDVIKLVRDHSGEALLIASKGKEEAIVQWLDKFTIMEDARFERATEDISQFLVCGPKANAMLRNYASSEITNSRDVVWNLLINSIPATLVKGPSLAGNGWFILSSKEHAEILWNELENQIRNNSGVTIGEEVFEVLRIENGTPIAPNEINEKHNPLELPLASETVSFTKGCYIGQEVIARLDAQDKVQRKLVGLKFSKGMAYIGDRISMESLIGTPLGDEIGDVTSVANSPAYGPVGLGYVRAKYANPGTEVSVKTTEDNSLSATIVTLPFYV
jgi:tRNA-modifying protein YgfZ